MEGELADQFIDVPAEIIAFPDLIENVAAGNPPCAVIVAAIAQAPGVCQPEGDVPRKSRVAPMLIKHLKVSGTISDRRFAHLARFPAAG